MSTFTKFSLRFAAYVTILSYLVIDLFLVKGPLRKRIDASSPDSPESIEKAKASGVVARVFYNHITRKQLDFAIYERLWIEGKKLENLSAAERKLFTYAALGDLIDHELMRVKVTHNVLKILVSETEIDAGYARFLTKFESEAELTAALKNTGIPSIEALRNRIAARIQQEKYIAMRVDPLVKVSDQEIADFFAANQKNLATPERIRVSQVFISSLETPSEEVKQTLTLALADLIGGKKDLATLAKELSTDSSSKDNGGDLGWMSRERLPLDFSEQVFPLAENTPTLIRTKIGWHLVNITAREPAIEASLEAVKPEVIAALSAVKRHQAVSDFRAALRQFETEKITIFHDQLVP